MNRPYGKTAVHIVGAGALDGPLVGHGRSSAERSGDRSLRVVPVPSSPQISKLKAQNSGRPMVVPTGNLRPLHRGGACPARLSDTPPRRRAIRESPLRETSVHIVGAGALDGPSVGHGRNSAERSGDRSLRRRGRADKPSVTAALRLPCHSQDPLLGRQGKLASQ